MVPVDRTLEKECAIHRYFLYTELSREKRRTSAQLTDFWALLINQAHVES